MTAPTTFTPATDDPVAEGVAWSASASASEIFVDRAYVRSLIARLEGDGDWSRVIEVARNTEHAMAQAGRWGTWRSILESARSAAIASGDREAEGWAVHQLGCRNLLRDDLGPARATLHHALAIREAIGDHEGAAATRHNLRILPLALAGVTTALTLFVGLVALTIPSFDHPDVPEARPILDITDEVVTLAEVQDPEFRIRLRNLGTVPLEGLLVTSEDPGAPVTGALVGCDAAIPIGGSCDLRLDVGGLSDGDLPLVVEVAFSSAAVPAAGDGSLPDRIGDSRVLIRSAVAAE